jgi:hypothetical protein
MKLRQCGRDFIDHATPVLQLQSQNAKSDLYDPTADHVLGGLFARQYRFLQTYVLDFHVWAADLGRVILRMMVETLIYLKYLSSNSPDECREFVKYGIGQEVLFKAQLKELVNQGKIPNSEELCSYLESPVDKELTEQLIKVKLKNFENLRKLSEECDLKDLYNLYYQPFSVTMHGHWPDLRRYYLVECKEPLHKFHLHPNFNLPPLDFKLLRIAVDLFLQSYAFWTAHYGLKDELTELVIRYRDCITSCFEGNTLESSSDAEVGP